MRDADGWVTNPLVPNVRYRRRPDSDDHEIQDSRTGRIWICGHSSQHCEETTILSGPSKGQIYSPCPCYLYDASTDTAYLIQRYDLINIIWMLDEKGFDPEAWKDIIIRSEAGRGWL